jgi:glycosyltransferase involved in cell wall biosynthesis
MITGYAGRTVFGSTNRYFYKLLPFLHSGVRCTDMVHNFGGQFEDISLPFVPRIERRVVVADFLKEGLRRQYAQHGIAPEYAQRIVVIENAVDLPSKVDTKGTGPALRVLYVGRGSAEKRVHLVARVASTCRRMGVQAEFVLIGDVAGAVAGCDQWACSLAGEVADAAEMRRFYGGADILLLTSRREGMPLVVMEAMAHGVVPICTDVGGISKHVMDGVNGVLVPSGDERRIVADMVASLAALAGDRARLQALSAGARRDAVRDFDPRRARSEYRRVLLGGN